MLQKLKLAILPALSLGVLMIATLSVRSANTPVEGIDQHKYCYSGTDGVCRTRECTDSGCANLVYECAATSFFEEPNCRK